MSIANVIKRGGLLYIYDEQGRLTGTVADSNRPGEGLQGFTSNVINVRRGTCIYTYDGRGHLLSYIVAGS